MRFILSGLIVLLVILTAPAIAQSFQDVPIRLNPAPVNTPGVTLREEIDVKTGAQPSAPARTQQQPAQATAEPMPVTRAAPQGQGNLQEDIDSDLEVAPGETLKWSESQKRPVAKQEPQKFITKTQPGNQHSLQAELDGRRAQFESTAPAAKISTYDDFIGDIRNSGILQRAAKTGDKAQDFALQAANGQFVSLSDTLKKGPVVLMWYRGGWCITEIRLGFLRAI